ncbi:MAG: nitronate monooxygenase [Roseibacillus sp.]|jgi:nitronate monooxygenase|nr:nitronate monooxygenase [Roseibacillus sp.]HJM63963.1 nitronate monooxygenase [Roseibacillus sp.]|tara:strand:+ start:2058 stop:3593 length:1536 start_codon:yes stop_codon:yes gene_type:complete
MMEHPQIIQGGMGIAVSDWRLAHAVAREGAMGVVSGTAISSVLARRLQLGDIGGHMRRALEHFPVPEIAEEVLNTYYRSGGKGADEPYKLTPMFKIKTSLAGLRLTVAANFTEVFLAKEGHDGKVGINFLEKIQLPHLASIYGAMLAGVNYVLMGAGIPRQIPGVLDSLSQHLKSRYKLAVENEPRDEETYTEFDPAEVIGLPSDFPLSRPCFIAIIASATLALSLSKKASGHVDGFVIEYPVAGGHNAPPRGKLQLTERGEPIYGPKDDVDLEKIAAIGRPFWLAGGYADPDRLVRAMELGATGIQVGSAFSLCEESGVDAALKQRALDSVKQNGIRVYTDATASPTGFPFKVLPLEDTASELPVYENRPRICDLGYLRVLAKSGDDKILYRCASEPIADYVKKGGEEATATGCKCLCNALLANVGQAQLQKSGFTETPLLTSGDDINMVTRFLSGGSTSYKAKQVLDFLRAPTKFDEAAAGDGEAQPLGSPARKPFEAGSSNDATNNAC